MIKSLLVLDQSGEIFIEKHFISGLKRSDFAIFKGLLSQNDPIPPLFSSFGNLYIVHSYADLYIVGVATDSQYGLHVAEIIIDIIAQYEAKSHSSLCLSKLKLDYHIFYEILEKNIGFGLPQFKPFNESTNRTNSSISYKIEEYIDINFRQDGYPEKYQIRGDLFSLSRCLDDTNITVSDKIGFISSDYLIIGNKFKVIPSNSFIRVLSYFIENPKIYPPVILRPIFRHIKDGIRFSIDFTSTASIASCTVSFLCKSNKAPTLASESGSVRFDHSENRVEWVLQNEKNSSLIGFIPSDSIDRSTFINVQFMINEFLFSSFGFQSNDSNMKEIIKTTRSGEYVFEPCWE